MCPPFLSLLVAIQHFYSFVSQVISLLLSPRFGACFVGVRPFLLAMQHFYSFVSAISLLLSPRFSACTASVHPFPLAMQHFYSFVSHVISFLLSPRFGATAGVLAAGQRIRRPSCWSLCLPCLPPASLCLRSCLPSCWLLCLPSCWSLCPPCLHSVSFCLPSCFPSCWSLSPPCLPSVPLCLRSCLRSCWSLCPPCLPSVSFCLPSCFLLVGHCVRLVSVLSSCLSSCWSLCPPFLFSVSFCLPVLFVTVSVLSPFCLLLFPFLSPFFLVIVLPLSPLCLPLSPVLSSVSFCPPSCLSSYWSLCQVNSQILGRLLALIEATKQHFVLLGDWNNSPDLFHILEQRLSGSVLDYASSTTPWQLHLSASRLVSLLSLLSPCLSPFFWSFCPPGLPSLFLCLRSCLPSCWSLCRPCLLSLSFCLPFLLVTVSVLFPFPSYLSSCWSLLYPPCLPSVSSLVSLLAVSGLSPCFLLFPFASLLV